MASSVWRGKITFGLVSIPVRLFKAARHERTRFHRVQRVPAESEPAPQRVIEFPAAAPEKMARRPEAEPDPEPVAERVVRVQQPPLPGPAPLKGYAVAEDEYVVVEPEEIKALRPRTSTELEITEFVEMREIDPVYFDVSYFIAPDSGAERPYGLLFAALSGTGRAGIGSLAMHGREHIAVIRSGRDALLLHTLFFANEISQPAYRAEGEPGPKELQLARTLVEALAAPFDPGKWKDRYEEQLKELLASRTPVPSVREAERAGEERAQPGDLMAALRKSLELAGKPPGREERVPTGGPKRKRT